MGARKKKSAFVSDRERALFAARKAVDDWAISVRDYVLTTIANAESSLSPGIESHLNRLRRYAEVAFFSPTSAVAHLKGLASLITRASNEIPDDAGVGDGGMVRHYANDDALPRIMEAIAILEAEDTTDRVVH